MTSNFQEIQVEPVIDVDRRQDARIKDSLPVFVTGRDRFGRRFSFRMVTWDIGACGLRAIAPQMMRIGEELSLRIRFARTGSTSQTAPEASAKCVVLRSESQSDGTCVFAAAFLKKRVL